MNKIKVVQVKTEKIKHQKQPDLLKRIEQMEKELVALRKEVIKQNGKGNSKG